MIGASGSCEGRWIGDVEIHNPGGEKDVDFVLEEGGTGEGMRGLSDGLLLGESKSMGDKLLSLRDGTLRCCDGDCRFCTMATFSVLTGFSSSAVFKTFQMAQIF